MRLAALLLPCVLVACTFVPGSADVLAPERDAPRVVPQPDSPDGDGGFALDAYKEQQAEADAAAPAPEGADLLGQLGAEGVVVPADPPLAATPSPSMLPEAGLQTPPLSAVPPVSASPVSAPPVGPERWTPANAVTLSWGLRLVSTVDAGTPPRAILGMPDGSEEVVKAGDLLPKQGVIVLAVGHDVVQLGQVSAQGDHAQVESVFLRAMFPGEGGGR